MKKNRIKVSCKLCGKEFETIPHRIKIGKGKYCSQKCYWEAKIGKRYKYRTMICRECGKEFIRNNWYFRPNRIAKNAGIYCGKGCLGKANGRRMKAQGHWNWKGGITYRNLADKPYILWRNSVLKRDGYKCFECESQKNLEVHHIKSWLKFPNFRYKTSNGQTLCQVCHYKKHRK